MSLTAKSRERLAAATLVMCAGFVVGCSKPTAQISGTAMFDDGSPFTGAVRKINFVPTDDSTAEVRKAAIGEIAEDGTFTMYTRKPGDGVFKGDYAVTFTVLKDPNYGGLLVPERYAAIDDTPLSISVTEDRDDLRFEVEKK